MQRIHERIGQEQELRDTTELLREIVASLGTSVVGAHHVTCSDESEIECISEFQHGFVDPLLPALFADERAAFRTSNLGSRYEWGAIRVAEGHYATDASREHGKCLLVKVNGHVSVYEDQAGVHYGPMQRYETESSACGALHALLRGISRPFTEELHRTFTADGRNRVATLLDPERVDPTYRYLVAAIASTALQARRAALDAIDHGGETPTTYLVVPCVTLNRPGLDTEIIVGLYTIDARQSPPTGVYFGITDDPAGYRIEFEDGRMRIRDRNASTEPLAVPDYRVQLAEAWRSIPAHQRLAVPSRVSDVISEIRVNRNGADDHDLLSNVLAQLEDRAPVQAAVALFCHGVAHIHHIERIQQFVYMVANPDEARIVLRGLRIETDRLAEDQVQTALDALLTELDPDA